MIMGLDRPASGTVTVNGKPYRHHRAAFELAMLARAGGVPASAVHRILDGELMAAPGESSVEVESVRPVLKGGAVESNQSRFAWRPSSLSASSSRAPTLRLRWGGET